MAENTVEVGIGVSAGDKSGLQLIKDTASSLEKTKQVIASAQKQGGLKKVVAQGEIQELRLLEAAAQAVGKQLDEVEAALANMAETDAGFEEKTKEAEKFRDELEKIALAAEEIPKTIAEGGSFKNAGQTTKGKEAAQATLGGIGGLASTFSPEAGQATQAVAQLLAVGDGVKKLSAVLIDAPGIIGAVSTSAASLAAPLGATAAGLSAVLAILLPVALAVAALAAVVTHFNDVAKQGEKDAQAFIDALDLQVKTDREIAGYLKSGDVAGAKKRYKELVDAQTDANAQLTYLYQKKADIDKQYADAQKNVNLNQLAYLGSEGGKVADEIKNVYEKQFTPAKQAAEEFGKALGDIAAAGSDKDAIATQIKDIQQRIAVEGQLTDLIRKGNSGAIKDRRQAIEDELTAIQNQIPQLIDLATYSEEGAAALKQATDRTHDLNGELELYSPAAQKAADAQAQLTQAQTDALAGYVQQINSTQQIAGLIKSASSSQLQDRLDNLATERDAILQQLPAIQELGKTNADAAAKAKEYENRLKAINNEYDQLGAAAPDVRAAEVQKGLDELQKAEIESDRKIADIRTAGLQKLADIETQFSDQTGAALKRRNEAYAKANDGENVDLQKADKDYMQSELDAWAKFRAATLKFDQQNQKDRLRIIDQTNAKLLDAEKANDVIAFIAAANAGKDQLKQQSQDASDAAQQRQADFIAEREQAQKEHDQRIEEIKAQAETAREEADKQYQADLDAAQEAHDKAVEQQNQNQEELIAAEEAGLIKRAAAIQDTYKLEDDTLEEFFNKRKARYTADDKIINDRLDLELQRHADDQKTKADIEIKEGARATKVKSDNEIKAGQAVASAIGQSFGQTITSIQSGLSSLISALSSQASAAASGSGSGMTSSGTYSGGVILGAGGLSATAFANEGVVNRPTIGLIGDGLKAGEAEAVVKFKPSEGLPKSMTGGGYNLSIGSLSIGADISRSEVEGLLMDGFMELADGLDKSRKATGGG